METIITYACDWCGERFDDEDECYDHETNHRVEEVLPYLKAWDRNGNPIDKIDHIATRDALFVSIETDEAWEVWRLLSEMELADCPDYSGLWYWDKDTDRWCEADSAIEKDEKLKRIFNL